MNYNVTENFLMAVEQYRDKVAIESRLNNMRLNFTYGELLEKVKRFAFFMIHSGIKKGDKVAIILNNTPEWAMIFFGLSYIGGVAIPIDPDMPERGITNIISDSGAWLAFLSIKNRALREPLNNLKVVYVEEMKNLDFGEDLDMASIESDDLMVILYTSGTTDIPKGVMLSHKNLCSNFYSISQHRIFSQKDIVLSVLPLYHAYSLMTTLIVPIFSGAKIVYVPSDWPERLVGYLQDANVSIFIGVPQVFHMMHSRLMKKLKELPVLVRGYLRLASTTGLSRFLLPNLRNRLGRNLRFFVSGGAKLDELVAKDFLKFGLKILEGYGLTETSPVISFNPLKKLKIGSVGKILPDIEVKILDRDINGVGEIAIKGPNVMKGYYNDEEKTLSSFKDGWFLSGDLGYIDKDAYLYITGRSKEIIVLSSGKNIYPEEIERHYSATPYVKEICVIGVLKQKGEGNIEYLYAIVVPDFEFFKDRGEMNVREVLRDIFDNLSKELPPYKHIMGFTVSRESLPRTVLGKIKRYEVERIFSPLILDEKSQKKEILPEEEELSRSDIAQRLIRCIKDMLGIESPVTLRDSIELDLGVDSLGRVELLCAIEKCFDIEISEEMVAGEIFTVKDILFKLGEALNKKELRVEKGGPKERPVYWSDILRQPLSVDFQRKILLKPGWIDYILTFLLKGFIALFFKIFYGLKVQGISKIPKKGPYIFCVNHTSFFDGFIVAASVPFRTGLDLFFIGFRRYFIAPFIRSLVRHARVIPIDASQIVEAMQASHFILKHNKALCVFPEGERSIDGRIKQFKKGVGIIAKELNIPLVPVYIKGAFEAWPRTQRFPKIHQIHVRFGEPKFSNYLMKKGKDSGIIDDYEAIASAIRGEMELLT